MKSENACLVSGNYSVHHLDHLAAVAYALEAPLVCDTELLHSNLKKYYPQIKSHYIHLHQEFLEYLAKNHDRVFCSAAFYRRDLSPMLEAFFGKEMEFWYCPHGNSDKTLEQYGAQHYALIYGDQMESRLIEAGYMTPLKAYVRTGNIRAQFYRKFQDFYDDFAEKEVFAKFAKKQTTYLYAPTWQDFESSSSLFEASIPLIEELPDSINLVVKMHPWLERNQPGQVNFIKEKYRDRPNLVLLCEYPLVLPILKRVDLYIGDFSSIGYDFLHYDRPMFFFDPEKRVRKQKSDTRLHTCGEVIPQEKYNSIFSFIERQIPKQEAFSEKRRWLYNHAFGEEIAFETIRLAVGTGQLNAKAQRRKEFY